MAADGGAVALGRLAGELELLLQGQHRLGVGELQPARTPGEGGVVEVERGIHIAPLMQLLELIEQGIELIVKGALLALDGNDGLEQTIDRFFPLAEGGDQGISREWGAGLR